jgi:hypothetical protein
MLSDRSERSGSAAMAGFGSIPGLKTITPNEIIIADNNIFITLSQYFYSKKRIKTMSYKFYVVIL